MKSGKYWDAALNITNWRGENKSLTGIVEYYIVGL